MQTMHQVQRTRILVLQVVLFLCYFAHSVIYNIYFVLIIGSHLISENNWRPFNVRLKSFHFHPALQKDFMSTHEMVELNQKNFGLFVQGMVLSHSSAPLNFFFSRRNIRVDVRANAP